MTGLRAGWVVYTSMEERGFILMLSSPRPSD